MTHARIVVIGDIHQQHGHRRNAARLDALDQILAAGYRLRDLAAWIVLGDVFHMRSTPDDRNAIAPRFQLMAALAPVFVVEGNHDAPGDLAILERLAGAHPITVVTRAQVIPVTLATGHMAAIFALPYPHKGTIVAAGVAGEQVRDVASEAIDAIVRGAAAEFAACPPDVLRLAIGHATLAGAVSSVGQPMGLERDIAVDLGALEQLGDMPKIFGHIHKAQELPGGALYAGSIARNDWGEVEDKRFLVLTATVAGRHGHTWAIESQPIACPVLWHVEGQLTRDGFDWRVTRGPDGEDLAAPTSFAGSEVRVRYRFNPDDVAALDLTLVRAPFADAAVVELEPIALRNRAVRAPEVAAATTLEEKVAAFVRASGREWTPALAEKLAQLQVPVAGVSDAVDAAVSREVA